MTRYPPISVLVTAYNHGKYISACLDSILNQDYPGEVTAFIGEDGSSDNTAEIVKAYADKFPTQIIATIHPRNLGGHQNFLTTFDACKDEWVAILEGDDFWHDSSKLRKQMDLLLANKNAVLCFSAAKSLDMDQVAYEKDKIYKPDIIQQVYSRTDLLRRNIIPTCTVLFKKSSVVPLPSWYSNWHLGDWTLYLESLKHGGAVYVDEPTATYRIHSQGHWSGVDPLIKFEKQEALINFLISIEEDKTSRKALYFNLLSQQLGLALIFISRRDFKKSLKKLSQSFKSFLFSEWNTKIIRIYIKKAFGLINYLKIKKIKI